VASKVSATMRPIYDHFLPGMLSTAAALMGEIATPIAAKLQHETMKKSNTL
jgi:hypothetical protein